MSDRTFICCPSHCCLEHGCKYGYEDCPVATGKVKQQGLCENCGLESEGYYGVPEYTREQQEEYLEGLWEEKQNPQRLTIFESAVAQMAKRHGRSRLITVLNEIKELPFSEHSTPSIQNEIVLAVLKTLKGIK